MVIFIKNIGVIMSRLTERIENFNRAFALFMNMQKNYISDRKNDSNKLALTQSFEITFELGWKILKDYLYTKDIEVFTPRDAVKSAFEANILPSAQIWIDMAKDRNASSHEYNMDKIDLMLERMSTVYFDELFRFQKSLRDFNE